MELNLFVLLGLTIAGFISMGAIYYGRHLLLWEEGEKYYHSNESRGDAQAFVVLSIFGTITMLILTLYAAGVVTR